METPREDLRTHLMAVLEAAPELPRDDREHLADVFLDELYSDYQLVPRSVEQRPRADFGVARQAAREVARRWWVVMAAGVALLFILPSLFWEATGGPGREHHPPVFLFFVLFFVAMRFLGPWRRGGRRRFTRTF